LGGKVEADVRRQGERLALDIVVANPRHMIEVLGHLHVLLDRAQLGELRSRLVAARHVSMHVELKAFRAASSEMRAAHAEVNGSGGRDRELPLPGLRRDQPARTKAIDVARIFQEIRRRAMKKPIVIAPPVVNLLLTTLALTVTAHPSEHAPDGTGEQG
jgi:hypothetical protein